MEWCFQLEVQEQLVDSSVGGEAGGRGVLARGGGRTEDRTGLIDTSLTETMALTVY